MPFTTASITREEIPLLAVTAILSWSQQHAYRVLSNAIWNNECGFVKISPTHHVRILVTCQPLTFDDNKAEKDRNPLLFPVLSLPVSPRSPLLPRSLPWQSASFRHDPKDWLCCPTVVLTNSARLVNGLSGSVSLR